MLLIEINRTLHGNLIKQGGWWSFCYVRKCRAFSFRLIFLFCLYRVSLQFSLQKVLGGLFKLPIEVKIPIGQVSVGF